MYKKILTAILLNIGWLQSTIPLQSLKSDKCVILPGLTIHPTSKTPYDRLLNLASP